MPDTTKVRLWLDDHTEVELFPNGQARLEVTELRIYGRDAEGWLWVDADGTSPEKARCLTWRGTSVRLAGREEAAAVRAILRMLPQARRLARESLREHAANATIAKKAAALDRMANVATAAETEKR